MSIVSICILIISPNILSHRRRIMPTLDSKNLAWLIGTSKHNSATGQTNTDYLCSAYPAQAVPKNSRGMRFLFLRNLPRRGETAKLAPLNH